MARERSKADLAGVVQRRTRKDLIVIGVIILIGCVAILADPDRAFEWIASHEEVRIDELLTAIVVIGSGFAIFSWRRWTDLSRQVTEYQRLQRELSAMNRDAALMGETDDLLQSCLSTEEAYGVVVRHCELQLPHLSGAIFAFSQGKDAAELMISWGDPRVTQKRLPVQDCWALRRGRVNLSLASDPKLACAHIGTPLPFYALCFPMMAQGETVGTLYLDTGKNTEEPEPLTEPEQRIVKTLAEHLASAVANLNLRESLRTQSIRDPLTGLFNRRYMEDSLQREFSRAVRKKLPLSVLMVDLDHFKRFNDQHGHEAGDAVLREVAKVLQTHLRAEDIACRYGGEEFMLILPEADLGAAGECAERLRTATEALRIPHYGETLEDLRLSAGVACYPQTGATAESLLRAADAALYKAKEQGRNRIVIAEPV